MATPKTYEDLVSSVFITPIRSVTIIDDAYPTWESWLDGRATVEKDMITLNNVAYKTETPANQIRDILAKFRGMSPAINVDIHDGQEMDGVSSYFHQSDLVILDYELSADAPKERNSMQIAKTLLTRNTHFNLIVMHTSEPNLELPFENVLKSLLIKIDWLDDEAAARGEALADEIQNYDALTSSFDLQQFAESLCIGNPATIGQKISKCEAPFQDAYAAFDQNWTPENIEEVIHFLLRSFQNSVGEALAGDIKPSMLKFSFEALPWIRTSFGFIVFSNKTAHPDPLSALLTALCSWEPTPSRLISAKIRGALEAQGISYEDELLQDPRVGWKQYRQLIGSEADTEALIQSEISRHMENFSDGMAPAVNDFGNNILSIDEIEEGKSFSKFEKIYGLTDQDEKDACLKYNCSVSLKPSSGKHLATGQILCLADKKFLVLSPLCDLVPGRGAGVSELKPFVVAELTAIFSGGLFNKALRDATTNHYIFLPGEDGQGIPHHIYAGDVSSSSVPSTRTWFAKNGGVFSTVDKVKSLTAYEVQTDEDGSPKYHTETYRVFEFQLRYEYALHFLSKIGSKASRVGLNFL